MTRPTHLLGDTAVFPQGYEPEDLTLIPEGYWKARDLADAKLAKWAEIKRERAAAIAGGVHVQGIGTFDSDPDSRNNVRDGEPGEWTLADNSVVTLDAEQLADAQASFRQHLAACHTRGRELRAAIEAAKTIKALEALSF